jgi:ribosomal protein S9
MRVDAEGLAAWSAQCAAAAGELAAQAPVSTGVPSGQATAAAVAASQAIAAAVAEVLSARVQSTGTKASIAASGYLTSDEQSAQRLGQVAPPPVVV